MIIGILGNKRVGKDTVADYLVEKYNFVKRALSTPLKKACQEIFLLSEEQLYCEQLKETSDPRWFNKTPRHIFQFVGTDLFRDQLEKLMPDIGKEIFLYNFQLWLQQEKEKNPNICVVIPDIRFQNEVDFIKNLNGTIIKLDRENNIKDTHASETEIFSVTNFDYFIENSNTKQDLYRKIDQLMLNIFTIYNL